MVDEIGGFDVGLDSQQGGEGGAEISKEDLIRVQEGLGNARKVASQKAKSQKKNNQYALMLSFIFKYVGDERLLAFVYTHLTSEKLTLITLFGLFLPYLKDHINIQPYKPLYKELRDNLDNWRWDLEYVIAYYVEFYDTFPQLENIKRAEYVELVMRWLAIQGIANAELLEPKDLDEIKKTVLERVKGVR